MYVHVCMYMYVCTCMYVCMCVMCMCACVYMYACIVTCRLRPTSAFHVTRNDPGTEAYEGLSNGLRIDLPVTFDAAPLDCAAGGVSAHLSSWRESKPIPQSQTAGPTGRYALQYRN